MIHIWLWPAIAVTGCSIHKGCQLGSTLESSAATNAADNHDNGQENNSANSKTDDSRRGEGWSAVSRIRRVVRARCIDLRSTEESDKESHDIYDTSSMILNLRHKF